MTGDEGCHCKPRKIDYSSGTLRSLFEPYRAIDALDSSTHAGTIMSDYGIPSGIPSRPASISAKSSISAHPLDDSPPSSYPVYYPQPRPTLATPAPAPVSNTSSPRLPSSSSSPSPLLSLNADTNLPNSSLSSSSSPLTRAAARSISEAREKLQTVNLKSELQEMGLGPESIGNAMIMKIAGISTAGVNEGSWKGVLESIVCGKVSACECEAMTTELMRRESRQPYYCPRSVSRRISR